MQDSSLNFTAQLGRLWRTVRSLRPVQIYYRIWLRVYHPKPDLNRPPPKRQAAGIWIPPAVKRQSLLSSSRLRFLNVEEELDQIGWDNPDIAKLWRYNLHYFDDLLADPGGARHTWHVKLVERWIQENPPGSGTGWEPYPTSLRIVNWIKWSLSGNTLSPDMLSSLATQTRWLSRRLEYHLLGNHLIANAKALIFSGCYFDTHEAAQWLSLGFRILSTEIPEQILPDGGHFELSPMYQALVLEDLLDLVNVINYFSPSLSPSQASQVSIWRKCIRLMMRWLATMCHPDGEIAFFNDAAIGIAPTLEILTKYSKRLNIDIEGLDDNIIQLEQSGYTRLTLGRATLIVDTAKLGPEYLLGHAHADTLSFEMSLDDKRLVVNGGTSRYGIDLQRLYERGTPAHSTLVIDGENSSEVWSGFRVGARAHPFDITVAQKDGILCVQASHDGYISLPGKPVHRRSWLLEDGSIRIKDEILGSLSHDAEINFHFAPGIHILPKSDTTFQLYDQNEKRIVASLTCETGVLCSPAPSYWHPEFGLSIETYRLRIALCGVLPLSHETIIDWNTA